MTYWKNKLKTHKATDFCSVVTASVSSKEKGTGVNAKEKDFLLLSDALQEDKDLRMHLQLKRLEDVLNIQEKERNDVNFERGCLFCRKTFNSASRLLNHMNSDHNFNVGQPNNLVFVNELLDVLEKKLDDNICIFCEKTFTVSADLPDYLSSL